MAGTTPAGRCERILADGSTAATQRSVGSYDPAPAPSSLEGQGLGVVDQPVDHGRDVVVAGRFSLVS